MDPATASVILDKVPLKWIVGGLLLWGAAHYGRDYVKVFLEHRRESRRIGLEHKRRREALGKRIEEVKYKRQRRK